MSEPSENKSDKHQPFFAEKGQVYVRVQINQILAVSISEETFTVEFDLFFRWQDPRLRDYQTRLWLVPDDSGLEGAQFCNRSQLHYLVGVFKELKGPDQAGKVQMTVKGRKKPHTLHRYQFKEEPDFDKYGEFIGEHSGQVTLSRLMETPELLTSHQRISDGTTGEVVLFQKLIGKFGENMEMKKFPFDRQLLRFKVTATVPTSVLRLKVEEGSQKNWCRVKDLPEYEIGVLEGDASVHKTLSEKTGDSTHTGKHYAQLVVTIYATRKPDKYLVNVVVLLFLLVLSSFSGVVVPLTDAGDREGSMVTFLLTIMALKYIVQDQLPSKAYQTMIDKYILFSFVLLCFPAIELVYLKTFWNDKSETDNSQPDNSETSFDRIFTWILLGVWLAMHVLIFTYYLYPCTILDTWETVKLNQDDVSKNWKNESKEESSGRSWFSCLCGCAATASESESDSETDSSSDSSGVAVPASFHDSTAGHQQWHRAGSISPTYGLV